jgi:phenylalanyl-tRNA synthetase alpha chain
MKLSSEYVDMTTPYTQNHPHIHPLTRTKRSVEDTFRRMGYDIHESDEMTTEYLNFDAVNVPKNHPARDMQDTFWLE